MFNELSEDTRYLIAEGIWMLYELVDGRYVITTDGTRFYLTVEGDVTHSEYGDADGLPIERVVQLTLPLHRQSPPTKVFLT